MLRKTLSAVIPLYFNFKKIKLKIISHKVVISGPFVGMKYVSQSIGSAYVCKILGTYEKEIQEYVLAPQLSSFDVFINIGSGEGYYAVGVAINNPNLNVIAFESNISFTTLLISAIPFKFKTLAASLNTRSWLFVNFPPPEIVSVESSILTALPV